MKKDNKKRIIDLAKAGGDDADLLLLESIEEIEEELESRVEEKLTPLRDEFSKIKEFTGDHIEQVRKVTQDILANVKGKDGADGRNGLDGINGKDGRDGSDGRDGLDGKDADVDIEEISTMVLADVMSQLPEATEITPEEIIDKLESREDDDRLDAKAIKGIKNYDDEIATLQNRTQLLVQLTNNTSSTSSSSLTVTESDGSPSVSNVNTLKFPNASVTDNGGGVVTMAFAGSGDVVGPASATDNAVARFDATTGKLIQNSGVTIDDSSFMTFPVNGQIRMETNRPTLTAEPLIRLKFDDANAENLAKAVIAYVDENDTEVIWLQAHNYLVAGNQHKHFSIEASDAAGLKQTRLSVSYGADVNVVNVNAADFYVAGTGGIRTIDSDFDGVLKFTPATTFDVYPQGQASRGLRINDDGANIEIQGLGVSTIEILDGVAVSGNLTPVSNNTPTLGTTALNWADLFLGSGALINFNNSDVVLTHSAGILTMGTGDLRVTTAGANTASVVTVGGAQTLTSKTLTSPVLNTGITGTAIASSANITAGTDNTLIVTPDGLAGSTIFGRKAVSIQCFEGATNVSTGNGKAYLTIPESLNGMNLVRAQATVVTAGTTNATTVMIHNKTDGNDMLSGAISIASAGTVGTVGTINTSFDDVATNDVLRIDVDSVSTTPPQGLMVVLEFQLA